MRPALLSNDNDDAESESSAFSRVVPFRRMMRLFDNVRIVGKMQTIDFYSSFIGVKGKYWRKGQN